MVTLAALVAVTVLVVLIKAGVTPFRIQGGFPSFHAAVAFALATVIYLMGGSPAVTLLALGLAAWWARPGSKAGFTRCTK